MIATRHNIAELYITWLKPDKAREYLQKNIEVMEEKAALEAEARKQKEEGTEEFPKPEGT